MSSREETVKGPEVVGTDEAAVPQAKATKQEHIEDAGEESELKRAAEENDELQEDTKRAKVEEPLDADKKDLSSPNAQTMSTGGGQTPNQMQQGMFNVPPGMRMPPQGFMPPQAFFNPALYMQGGFQGGFHPGMSMPNNQMNQQRNGNPGSDGPGTTEEKGESDKAKQQPAGQQGAPSQMMHPNPMLFPQMSPGMMNPAFLLNRGGMMMGQPFMQPARMGISLALACDVEQLSDYQILVRQQLELFDAGPEDVESNTQGRKKPVVPGQVGLRCRHCAAYPLRARGRGAVYYPAKLQGIYQAAQNMAGSHLCQSCQHIPPHIRQEIRKLRERRDNASGGKQYWADGCRALGIIENETGLRLGPRPSG